MSLRGILWACSFLFLSGLCGAHAEIVGDETKCSAVTALMERTPPDKAKQQEALQYIVSSMRALDRAYALKGKPEILPKMTDEGQNSIALFAANRCKNHGDLPVGDVAVDTYQSVRAIQDSLGFSEKPKPKQSRPRTSRRRNAAPAQRRVANRSFPAPRAPAVLRSN
jgi:hypothetical protein